MTVAPLVQCFSGPQPLSQLFPQRPSPWHWTASCALLCPMIFQQQFGTPVFWPSDMTTLESGQWPVAKPNILWPIWWGNLFVGQFMATPRQFLSICHWFSPTNSLPERKICDKTHPHPLRARLRTAPSVPWDPHRTGRKLDVFLFSTWDLQKR